MQIDLDELVLVQDNFRLEGSFAFRAGAVCALIGPSGGGKSTLLSAIAGFVTATSGSIRIGGADMNGVAPAGRPVTLLFQDHNLFPHLSVARNVGLGLRSSLRQTSGDRAAIAAALARVGLAGFESRMPGSLSGGQAGRVALARALLRDKPVLLLDEPFAALGPALRNEMLDLVAEVQRERKLTVLLVTHIPDDAMRIAAFSALVANGRVEPPEPTAELLGNPPKALRDYLGQPREQGR